MDYHLRKTTARCEALSSELQLPSMAFSWDGGGWIWRWRARTANATWQAFLRAEPDERDSGAVFRVGSAAESETGGTWSREYVSQYIPAAKMDREGADAFLPGDALRETVCLAWTDASSAAKAFGNASSNKPPRIEKIRDDLRRQTAPPGA